MAYFQENKWHPKQKIIAIGNTTATTLETLGFSNFIISKSPSEEELAAAVVSVFDS
jgi:uroporphyrinogen-III synthase